MCRVVTGFGDYFKGAVGYFFCQIDSALYRANTVFGAVYQPDVWNVELCCVFQQWGVSQPATVAQVVALYPVAVVHGQ